MTHLPDTTLHTIAQDALRADHVGALRALFDAEYLPSHGTWDPDLPYGYAGHDVHVMALRHGAATVTPGGLGERSRWATPR